MLANFRYGSCGGRAPPGFIQADDRQPEREAALAVQLGQGAVGGLVVGALHFVAESDEIDRYGAFPLLVRVRTGR